MSRRFSGAVLAVVLLLTATLAACSGADPVSSDDSRPATAEVPVSQVSGTSSPDIVLILMDDFSRELLATMPNAQQMVREGASYRNAFVVDSLCCPSRAALLTGQTPHQTGVRLNTSNGKRTSLGGYDAFVANDNERKQFSVALQNAGYHTGFIGKYLNGYSVGQKTSEQSRRAKKGEAVPAIPPPKVPGWTEWNAILGGGYNGWGYLSTYLDDDGEVALTRHPVPPRYLPDEAIDAQYATNVSADLAVDFLERNGDGADPYFLEVATYGTHARLGKAYPDSPAFPPAMADQADKGDRTSGNCGPAGCGSLTLKDLAGYNDPRGDNAPTYLRRDGSTRPAPAWRTNKISLTRKMALNRYRDRARMAASIDRLIGRVREAAGPDTYVVLTSDNGFHLGQHQLNGGKGTPYDSDTRVPLVVVGPGVKPGVRGQFVNNIDLAPTIERIAGLPDRQRFHAGRSFASTLRYPDAKGGNFAFFEHTWAKTRAGEVDTDESSDGASQVIPSYIAVRGRKGLLARFDLEYGPGTDYAYELYRYDVPWEDRNVFAQDHDKPYAKQLMRRLNILEQCKPNACRAGTR